MSKKFISATVYVASITRLYRGDSGFTTDVFGKVIEISWQWQKSISAELQQGWLQPNTWMRLDSGHETCAICCYYWTSLKVHSIYSITYHHFYCTLTSDLWRS